MSEGFAGAAPNDDGTFGPYSRLRCACCGAPTLENRDWLDAASGESAFPQVCVLCEWENASADPLAAAQGSDDGISLVEAQANFDRYHWMYDPTSPKPWMRAVPTSAELDARRALREIFRAIEREPEGSWLTGLWEAARDAEATVAQLASVREQVVDAAPNQLFDDMAEESEQETS
jgi:Cysteine-rich CPCC